MVVAGFDEHCLAGGIVGSGDCNELFHADALPGIECGYLQGLHSVALAAVGGRDVHSDGGVHVGWVEVIDVDSANCFPVGFLAYNEANAAVGVYVAVVVVGVVPQLLPAIWGMGVGCCPLRGVVFPAV